jgi:phosphatidylcholine synthase
VAYLVHAYTATGVIWGFLALRATMGGDHRTALLWLVLATFVDATDGFLARFVDIARRAPLIDGARLDDIVDYVTFVLAPAVIVWSAALTPPTWTVPVVSAMLLSSACGFARRDAKTADHYFTGFPSYWNIVVVYLLALRTPPAVNAALLVALAVLVFVPIRYVYPSRTVTLMRTTIVFCTLWGMQMLALIWTLPDPPAWLTMSALAFPLYYTALSFYLSARRQRSM